MYTITEASILDLNSLHKLEKICFPQDAWPILDLIAVLTFPNVIRLKATVDGQMVGFIAGDPHQGEGIGWIATVGVLPEFRRNGIGKGLIAECEKRMGLPKVRLSVRFSNNEAITLYEGLGYSRINIWKDYYNDGGNALVMEKNLSN